VDLATVVMDFILLLTLIYDVVLQTSITECGRSNQKVCNRTAARLPSVELGMTDPCWPFERPVFLQPMQCHHRDIKSSEFGWT